MSSARVTIDLAAGQILTPGRSVRFEFSPPVQECHEDYVQVVTAGTRRRLKLELSEGGRFGKVRLPEQLLGACELQIVDADDRKPERIRRRVPFSVVPISGKVAKDQRIGQIVRLREEELGFRRLDRRDDKGAFFDVIKIAPRDGGAYTQLVLDEAGQSVDFAAVVDAVEARRASRYGKVHEVLYELMERLNGEDTIDVVVWPPVSVSPAPFAKSSEEPPCDEVTKEELAVLDEVRSQLSRLSERLAEMGVKVEASDEERNFSAPYIHATATVDQVRELAQSPEVGGVFLDDPRGIEDLDRSLALSRADTVLAPGTSGANVKVAVWELGPEDKRLLAIADQFGSDASSLHASLTTSIIKNRQVGPQGYAPDCQIYSANSYRLDAFEWAIMQGCTVVNQSFHRPLAGTSAVLDNDDCAKDWATLFSPFPTIVQAAGNFSDDVSPPGNEYVNHKGFNTLTVGNHDEQYVVAADSVFRNPSSVFGDRELPTLAANGTSVNAIGLSDSGTSFAAPAVAGVVALLQSADAILQAWPEGCRAVIMASARRPASLTTTWAQDIQGENDARMGAGCLDAGAAVRIVGVRSRPAGASSAVGWDVGTLVSAAFDAKGEAISRYTLSVPAGSTAPMATVALCWSSAIRSVPSRGVSSVLTVDLDLRIRETVNGVDVATSASCDNSYEVAHFYPEPGGVYELIMTRASGSDDVRFGIAWIVQES